MQTRKEAHAAVSILPPGDILLEVTRAADPKAVAAAHARLQAQAAGRSGNFDVPVAQAKTARTGSGTEPPEHFVQFEAMVLQTFLKSMLPEEAETHYGKGLAGEMWRDLFADALGTALAKHGGIGIAEHVLGQHGADEQRTGLTFSTASSHAADEAGSEASLATALVQEIERHMAKRLDGEDEPSARKPS